MARFRLTRSSLLLAIFSLFLGSPVSGQPPAYPPHIEGAHEEIYKTVGEVELKLWVVGPDEAESSQAQPAIIFFFGGGWKQGSPTQFEQHCRYLAERGMVAIVADYRVLSRHQTFAEKSVTDAKSAIRFVRRHARRLGIDPDRIAAAGGSAGGHLAACTAVLEGLDEATEDASVSSVPNALALFNPALVIEPIGKVSLPAEKVIEIRDRSGVPLVEISPAQHIESAIPPTIIFHGTNDESVPLATAEKFQELAIAKGSRCELVTYRDQGHGFFNYRRGGNPGEYFLRTVGELDRFLVSLGWLNGAAGVAAVDSPNAHLRQDYHQLARKFRETKRGSVAFLGGSITEMDGYRPMVAKFLRQEFPETEFTFTNAGIASTCSTTGAYRLQRDVLNAKPDLLLVEFAVNDDQDAAHAARECRRGMEGILRHTLSANPETKIVVTHFVNPTMLQTLTEGSTPLSSGTHEEVAEHYQVSSSDLAREVAERIGRGELTWEEYGGTHPKKPGNRIAADLVIELLSAGWDESAFRFPAPGKRRLPKPLDAGSYDRGRLVDVRRANLDSKTKPSWNIQVPEWSSLPGQCRSRFVDSEMLVAEAPGASLTLSFTGTTIGAYLLAGPDAGMVEVSVDGSPYRTIDLYHRYSRGLHYPRTVMFAGDLDDGTHQLSLRVSEDRHAQSQGTAVRILQFAVNGGD